MHCNYTMFNFVTYLPTNATIDLILCDTEDCPNAYHRGCAKVDDDESLDGEWHCPFCTGHVDNEGNVLSEYEWETQQRIKRNKTHCVAHGILPRPDGRYNAFIPHASQNHNPTGGPAEEEEASASDDSDAELVEEEEEEEEEEEKRPAHKRRKCSHERSNSEDESNNEEGDEVVPLRKNKTFDQQLRELKAYKEEHGHVNVDNKVDKKLYTFTNGMRRASVNKGSMLFNAQRKAKLDALGFDWEWSGKPRASCKNCQANHKKCDGSQSYCLHNELGVNDEDAEQTEVEVATAPSLRRSRMNGKSRKNIYCKVDETEEDDEKNVNEATAWSGQSDGNDGYFSDYEKEEDDEKNVDEAAAYKDDNDDASSVAQIPSGWIKRWSTTKEKAYYYHREFGTAWNSAERAGRERAAAKRLAERTMARSSGGGEERQDAQWNSRKNPREDQGVKRRQPAEEVSAEEVSAKVKRRRIDGSYVFNPANRNDRELHAMNQQKPTYSKILKWQNTTQPTTSKQEENDVDLEAVAADAENAESGEERHDTGESNDNATRTVTPVLCDGGDNTNTMASLKQSLQQEDSDDDDDLVTEFRRQQQERDRAAADEDGVLNGGSIEEELSSVRQRVATVSNTILHGVVDEVSTQLLSGAGGLQKQAIEKATSQLEEAMADMKATHVMKLDADEQKIKALMLGKGGITRKALEEACLKIDSAKKKISNEYDRQLNEVRQHLGKKISQPFMPSSRFTFGQTLTVGLVSGIVGYMLHK